MKRITLALAEMLAASPAAAEMSAAEYFARGQVWCRECGATQRVDSGDCMQRGWPKCCGYTMTIDALDENLAKEGLKDMGPL